VSIVDIPVTLIFGVALSFTITFVIIGILLRVLTAPRNLPRGIENACGGTLSGNAQMPYTTAVAFAFLAPVTNGPVVLQSLYSRSRGFRDQD